jgi:hypothetical protein
MDLARVDTSLNGKFMEEQPSLPIAQYRLDFKTLTEVNMPEYSGSAWRGAFGHAFKKAVCLTKQPQCKGCFLISRCPYSYLFESHPPENRSVMKKYPNVPHPYLLNIDPTPNETLAASENYGLGVTLIGRGNEYLPYVLHAFDEAGKQGIGEKRGKLKFKTLSQWNPHENRWDRVYTPANGLSPHPPLTPKIPSIPSEKVKITFITPMQLKRDGKAVQSDQMEFHDLFRSLLRRVSMLSYFHGEGLYEPDFRALTSAAMKIPLLQRTLRYKTFYRYSTRQNRGMKTPGFVGEIVLSTEHLSPFWPYLVIGEQINTGGFTSIGLGKFKIEAVV